MCLSIMTALETSGMRLNKTRGKAELKSDKSTTTSVLRVRMLGKATSRTDTAESPL